MVEVNENDKRLPEKVFSQRNSLLTDLIENNPHIKSIYHVFVGTLICLFVNAIAQDFFNGTSTFGLEPIFVGFRDLHISAIYWIGANLCTFGIYYIFNAWAKVRIRLPPKSKILRIWDVSGLIVLIAYYIFACQIVSMVIRSFNLPPATAVIILLEQIRLLMKVHSYIRTNIEKLRKYKVHSDQVLNLPTFSKFLYFLFVPTLIYKDEYPRTSNINWKFVMYNLFEFVGVIFYFSFIFQLYIFTMFKDYGLRIYSKSEILLKICENAVPGIMILLLAFYVTLQVVQNIFAEILRFGDRQFYKDWWNSNFYAEYFRRWNMVVHDWLYAYIYKDIYENITKNKFFGKVMVFLISAIVHEWIMCEMLGFFFPALSIQFVFFGTVMSYVKVPKSAVLNILFWSTYIFGCGLTTSLYTLEYHARINVPMNNDSWRNFFLPRWYTCENCIA